MNDKACSSGVSSKPLNLEFLLAAGFPEVPRESVATLSNGDIYTLVHNSASNGVPLVLADWHKRAGWDPQLFSINWLLDNMSQESIKARNLITKEDIQMPLAEYVHQSRTNQDLTEVLYAKDANCPREWQGWLQTRLPPELLPTGPDDMIGYLPAEDQPETLMCYIGGEGTSTPWHKDLCASVGQNLLCYSENGGSAFWFLTRTEDADAASTYFKGANKDMDWESNAASVEELEVTPFPVYACQQTLGDLVIVPPRSWHQVANYGGITTKISWSRMTLSSLDIALDMELPIYRRICRQEVYRVKLTLFCAMQAYVVSRETNKGHAPWNLEVLRRMLELMDGILIEEYDPSYKTMKRLSSDSEKAWPNVCCDFCGSDCFQSWFRCDSCGQDGGDDIATGFNICPGCYVEGRSCSCRIMEPMQARDFGEIIQVRDKLASILGLAVFNARTPEGIYSSVFKAACLLQKSREENARQRQTRRCTLGRSNSRNHDMDMLAMVVCRGCHRSTCFTHLLGQYCIHSCEAILVTQGCKPAKPESGAEMDWHEYHKGSKARYQGSRKGLTGPGPNPPTTRNWAAMTYNICRPITLQHIVLGWYDTLHSEDRILIEEPEAPDVPLLMEEDISLTDSDAEWVPNVASGKRKASQVRNTQRDHKRARLSQQRKNGTRNSESGQTSNVVPIPGHETPLVEMLDKIIADNREVVKTLLAIYEADRKRGKDAEEKIEERLKILEEKYEMKEKRYEERERRLDERERRHEERETRLEERERGLDAREGGREVIMQRQPSRLSLGNGPPTHTRQARR